MESSQTKYRFFKRINVVEIVLEHTITDEEEKLYIPLFKTKKSYSTLDIERLCSFIERSESIKAVVVKLRELHIGMAKAESIARSLSRLRECGKKVYVYAENLGNIEYLIASQADKIYMPMWGMLNIIGIKAEITFIKDALDKLGVEAIFKGLGEYKSAGEMFTRSSMSKPSREMMESIYQDLNAQFIGMIAEGRGLTEQEVQSLIDSAPYLPENAVGLSLIDTVCYEDDVDSLVEKELSRRLYKADAFKILRSIKLKNMLKIIKETIFGNKGYIAYISDTGIITGGDSSSGSGYSNVIGSNTMINMLEAVERDNSAKGLVLRVSSPGGSGLASDLILNKLRSLSAKIPVVVSMSDVAASGGYLISLAATKIVAENTTLTGSIGILSGKFNFEKLMKKAGISHESITFGKRSMMLSPTKGYTKDEEKSLMDILQSYYNKFVSMVSEYRNLEFERTESISRGRVWTGKQAKQIGLVDEIGGLREAFDIASKEAGIYPEETLVKIISKPFNLKIPFWTRGMGLEVDIFKIWKMLNSINSEPILALMPYWINIR